MRYCTYVVTVVGKVETFRCVVCSVELFYAGVGLELLNINFSKQIVTEILLVKSKRRKEVTNVFKRIHL